MRSRFRCSNLVLAILSIGGLTNPLLWPPHTIRATSAPAPTLEQSLKKATVGGKYRMLLRQLKVEQDKKEYGTFCDLGFRDRRQYAGSTDLPRGFWVYVSPYWYIWRDYSATAQQRQKRAWGPEQATGEPDTPGAGDLMSAWASQSPDNQDEWLMLEYAQPVIPTTILVHETYNPGALYRVTAFRMDGEEVAVWNGKDPTSTETDRGVSEIPLRVDFKTSRIKIYLASKNVAGWNEIDAVGLRDKSKKIYWAISAEASSTYAQPFPESDTVSALKEERIERLEKEVQELKAALEALKKSHRGKK